MGFAGSVFNRVDWEDNARIDDAGEKERSQIKRGRGESGIMSRSGYSEDLEPWDLIRWRGQVASAIRGKRGQKLLMDLLSALDAMPEKALISHELETENGEVCALGALGKYRGMDMSVLDPGEPEEVAAAFDIAHQLAQEIVYMNDDDWSQETPEHRWTRMRAWVAEQIISVKEPS